MAHSVLIVLHAGSAVAAFVLGCLLLATLPVTGRAARFVAFFWCVIASMSLLVGVVLFDWAQLDTAKRIAFGILCALAAYLVVRVLQARATLIHKPAAWRRALIGHIGFVMISLFDGFCIVSAIDLRLAPWLIVTVAVLGVVVGVVVIRALVRRDAAGEPARAN
jgi:hypothetical protein